MTMHAAAIIPIQPGPIDCRGRRRRARHRGARRGRQRWIQRRGGRAVRTAGSQVVVHTVNRGKGYAVRTGIARVLAGAFTHVLLLDADMQHLPEEAAALLAKAETSGAEVVLGQRRFDRSRMPASRYHANRIGSRVLSWFVGVPVQDTQCGFRAFRLDALRPLRLTASGCEIEIEMRGCFFGTAAQSSTHVTGPPDGDAGDRGDAEWMLARRVWRTSM